ncbi:MAG TPA: PaaI family thioesterase [Rhodocyclaceae bacterium]|nr:PaaI family thioesterase [Rhodocyclaceae bacterium]
MSRLRPELTVERFNRASERFLPGRLGVELVTLEQGRATSRMVLDTGHLAPNARLHAASIVALADTTAGHATMAHLPEGAVSFATIELKSNHLATLTDGTLACVATARHLGRNTQVWDAVVTDEATGRELALYRCTQMALYG